MSNHDSVSIPKMVYGGMMAALVFVATCFLKLPIALGYIHLGDGFILLGAALIGWTAVPAAAIGGALADLLSGYSMYCIPTVIIKAGMAAIAAFAFSQKKRPRLVVWALLAAAEGLMTAGYFITEWLFLGYGLAAATASVGPNLVQGASGIIVTALALPLAKKLPIGKGERL